MHCPEIKETVLQVKMRWWCCLGVLFAMAAFGAAEPTATVNTTLGPVRGIIKNGVDVFVSIM